MDRARVSKTAITEGQEEPTIDDALTAAVRFDLKASKAKSCAKFTPLLLTGAGQGDNSVSKHPCWMPTPAPSNSH